MHPGGASGILTVGNVDPLRFDQLSAKGDCGTASFIFRRARCSSTSRTTISPYVRCSRGLRRTCSTILVGADRNHTPGVPGRIRGRRGRGLRNAADRRRHPAAAVCTAGGPHRRRLPARMPTPRRCRLDEECGQENVPVRTADDPVIIAVPRRNIDYRRVFDYPRLPRRDCTTTGSSPGPSTHSEGDEGVDYSGRRKATYSPECVRPLTARTMYCRPSTR